MNVPLLDLIAQHQSIRDEVLQAVLRVLDRQQFILGKEVAALERAVAGLSHARHAIGCASGTDALLLSLRTLDLAPGDEVITPAFTFFATAGTIHNTGGRPVFADIERDSFNLDPAAVEAAITPRTRAIVVVHLFGQMARLEAIEAIARRHGLPVIEDAAQAIGATRQIAGVRKVAGESGYTGTLSFFPSKNLGGWGDGGMILTQDDALATRLSRLRTHGGARQYHHDEVGYNSRLDTLQAAVLLAKLPHLEAWSAARRSRAARYTEFFSGLEPVRPPAVEAGNAHIFHQYTLRVERRDELVEHLRQREIGCAVYYPLPLHLQPCFAYLGYRTGSLPVTEQAAREVVSLPIFPELDEPRQQAVIDAVRGFYGGLRGRNHTGERRS
jgi:dTDP-4-amino-4,6-dideoxygalactose transaminase